MVDIMGEMSCNHLNCLLNKMIPNGIGSPVMVFSYCMVVQVCNNGGLNAVNLQLHTVVVSKF